MRSGGGAVLSLGHGSRPGASPGSRGIASLAEPHHDAIRPSVQGKTACTTPICITTYYTDLRCRVPLREVMDTLPGRLDEAHNHAIPAWTVAGPCPDRKVGARTDRMVSGHEVRAPSQAWRKADIVALAERVVDLYPHGEQCQGACPWCGEGHDRFVVWPAEGRLWCRVCHVTGDQATFAMRWWGLSFPEAVARLETLPKREVAEPPGRLCSTPEPSQEWREMHTAFIDTCERDLWSSHGRPAREYLHRRGLKDTTIRAARLGLSLHNELGVAGISCVDGIVIPWFAEGTLWRLKIRRWPADRGGRYAAPRDHQS